ncbi:MAG: hypothetical protein H0X62_01705 [Bacteroidetes bacterium]|nr:hypothetical protein [Bacteroidota bacterium]
MALLFSTQAAQNTLGSVVSNPPKSRIKLSALDTFRQNISAFEPNKRHVYDKLYDLLSELINVNKELRSGEMAEYAGFSVSGTFSESTLNWHKLTYFIAFRAPFIKSSHNDYFDRNALPPKLPGGNWYRKSNYIRLKLWQNASSFSNIEIKRLCLNGEEEVYAGSPSGITNEITPMPIPKSNTTRGDYAEFGITLPSGLLGAGEEYFGTNHNSTDPNDNSGIPLEYFLTAHKIENPYDTGNWLGNPKKTPTSKPHYAGDDSGITIGMGLDLGTSGISSFNANDPNADEFTLNRLLLNLTSTWQNFTEEQKNIIYSITTYGISNIVSSGSIKRYRTATSTFVRDTFRNNKALFESLDLQNVNGGYTKTLKEFGSI